VIHTLNMADMLPLATIWPGRDTNPCPFYPPNSPPLFLAATTGSTPFRFNWHIGELGHGLIFGPTRAGKSTALALIAAQFRRYPRARLTSFDKGNSLWALTNAIGEKHGARHYDVGADDSRLAFCPLQHLDGPSDRLWAVDWVEICFNLQTSRERSPQEHRAIEDAIKQLAEAPSNARSLTNFCSAVQNEAVRDAMRVYTLDGVTGHLLDAEEDGLDKAPFRVFELDNLMRMDDKVVIPVMTYIIRQFQRSLDGSPAMLIIDEAWVMFQSPIMRPLVREWLLTLGKANCVVILATQSLSQAAESGLLPILIESCATKIYLPNPEAGHATTRKLYEDFGLNETEIKAISEAQRQRQYYVCSFDGRRMIDLGLGRATLAFAGVSDKDKLRHLAGLKREYGDEWPRAWLEELGCAEPYYAVTKSTAHVTVEVEKENA
jgi:type IV secretion system protein VirB4